MNEHLVPSTVQKLNISSTRYLFLIPAFFYGLLIPMGFAPIHLPGLSILGLALFYAQIRSLNLTQALLAGFVFGLGFYGLGVSWVYVSIRDYGNLNTPISALVTLLFLMYLSAYTAGVAVLYKQLDLKRSFLYSGLLFSALWCLSEYLRSVALSGFPWLLLGFGQIDAPLKYLLPIIGIYGVGFLTCFSASCLVASLYKSDIKRYIYLIMFVLLLTAPALLKQFTWTTTSSKPLSVGIIQANLSMRNKWDESLFWHILQVYKQHIEAMIGKKQIIVMPESAIPVPENYVSDLIDTIHQTSKQAGTAVLFGIPQPTFEGESFYNALMAVGVSNGTYYKQHLVPFGEYIPKPFERIIRWLQVPFANLKPGIAHQQPIRVHDHPIASLICYELAYPELLRQQLPTAEWIVSISDDGWFGHSFAMYQQLQMSQVLSLMTGRYQIVSNNDGLSSVIDTQGDIINSLPPFTAGLLEDVIFSATGATPWVYWGDRPVLIICLLFVFFISASTMFKSSKWSKS